MNHPKPHSSAHSSVDVTETEYSSAKYVFEASFAQKRLWLVDQLLSDKSVYNIPAAIRLKGSIQYEALEQTFRAIIHRHDTLRTTFKENDGDIVQIVEESILWRLSIEDLASLPEDVRWERAVGLAELEATAPFDLETGPLFRIRLIRIGESDHLLLVNLHHIISDGWSTGILMQELSLLYKAFSNGKKIELPELPVQYADFAYFQKEWMQGEAFEANLSFWKEKLSGELPVLELYTAYPRSAKSGDGGRTFKFTVNSAVSRAIKELSRREGATSFMTLLALYKVWLYRYSNQTDLLVGTPVAGRDSEEVEGLIGFLVNNLVIRSHLSAADSFRNLLRQVKSTVVEAYRYQEVPFEKVVEVVQPVRDAGATPIFQTMFVFQQQDISFELEGLQSERVELERGTSKFDLLLELTESEEGFSGVLEYSTDLFIPGTVEQMAAHFTRLLESAAANPEERVGRLAMLNEAEVHQQTVEWNRTEQRLPNWSLQERFEEQAARTPERTALVWGTAELTYGELNRQANRLAHRLQSLGVGPDKLVGVCLERSPELVIGMLAVIKAGGAYVPVDPALPQERRRDMMKRAGLKVLVTRQAFTEGVDSDTGMTVVCVDADQAILEAEREGNPQAQASADNLMYVIYTSGSTGLPKGASVYRRGFANLMQWYIGEFGMTEADRVLLITSPSFDLTQKNIFAPLVTGGQLVLLPTGPYDPREVAKLIEQHGITLLNGTPSAFYPLVDETEPHGYGQLGTLRHVFLGGEPIAPDRLSPWTTAEACRAEVVNTYGPTECTDVTVYHRMPDMRSLEGNPVPIGRPTPNTRLYILNEELGLVPVGAPGELCIAGTQVGGGYVGDAERTAEKFVANPYGEAGSEVLYRTGDLAKYMPDGTIVYLGRMDHQVKIRGYRIELGEIEAALRDCEQVKDAVVLAREDHPGDKRLVAYVVPEAEAQSEEQQQEQRPKEQQPEEQRLGEQQFMWREELSRKLPEYMVPWTFVVLEELPLSPNGKVDRKALPAPDAATGRQERPYVSPRNDAETSLAQIWAEVLQVERVGIHDNFFERGGHSLSAMSLLSKMNKALAWNVSLSRFFANPSIAALDAELIGKEPLASIPKAATRPFYPLSPAQRRLFVLHEMDPDSTVYNMPVVLEFAGTPDMFRLQSAFMQLIRRHESLRTSFALVEGEPVQRVEDEVEFSVEVLEEATEAQAAQRIAEWIRPFNLSQAPLLRVFVIQLDNGNSRILFDMHHIVSDGVSIALLTKEFMRLYSGETLPELEIQYKDYAIWYLEQLQGDEVKASEAYWLDQFQGKIPLLMLHTDLPRPSTLNFLGDRLSFEVDSAVTSGLRQLAEETGGTLYMVLLAAYHILLSKYSGQNDIIVGTAGAGRNHSDTEGIIGMFVNTLAIRNRLQGEISVLELVQKVKANVLQALEHAAYPFEELVRQLDVQRDLSRNPLFDVMFVMQNMASEQLQLDGVQLSSHLIDHAIAKFDLTLEATETKTGLSLHLEYNTSLFAARTAEQMAAHFTRLLDAMARFPSQALRDLELLTAEDKDKQLSIFNNTAADYPQHATIHRLFEEQVKRAPDAVAIVYGEQFLTYAQLNRQANQLARRLINDGLQAEGLVGMMIEHSLEVIIGMLGILKAGGVYVPINSADSQERIEDRIAESGIKLLLTKDDGASRISFDGRQINLSALESAGESYEEGTTDLELGIATNHLAYVMYTSGSTGKPKGVLIEHKSIANLSLLLNKRLAISTEDRTLLVAGNASYTSVWETIIALLSGARLYIADQDTANHAEKLAQYIQENQITVATLPPSTLLKLGNGLHTLQKIISTGAALPDETCRALGPQIEIINMYGSAEVAICAALGVFQQEQSHLQPTVPIGTPVFNTRVYILDADLRLVPQGVAGELCIAGDGLARGYLNRPQLTAEKFVALPFAPNERIYRTGDLARWLPDGRLEYIGRMEQQLGRRGLELETGKIESMLLRHEQVHEAVVIVREDQPGQTYLCAYVTGSPELRGAGLRDYLIANLPNYTVPSYIVSMKQLPYSAAGKVDRTALPKPDASAGRVKGYVAPRNETEKRLADLWQDILGVKPVGVHDNFFELGGHSLTATRAISRIRSMLNADFPLRLMFENPTVAKLAAATSSFVPGQDAKGNVIASGKETSEIPKVQREHGVPLSFAQQRLWFLDRLQPGNSAYNIYSAVKMNGQLQPELLRYCLNQLAQRHETLRTTFREKPEPVQWIAPSIDLQLPIIDLRLMEAGSRAAEMERLALEEAARAFDLESGPLLSAVLLRMDETEYVLLITMHHIISDGWSIGVLIRELGELYAASLNGAPAALPELTIQYADYTVWQNSKLSGEGLNRQKTYWMKQLGGDLPVLELPADYPRPELQTFRGGRHIQRVAESVTTQLKQVSKQENVTLFMTLLSAFSMLLHRLTLQEDLIIGTPIAGRNRTETEPLIGCFLNTLALRVDLAGNPSFEQLLQHTRTVCLDAYAHQDVPFEKLVEWLQPERSLSRNPIFDVMINYVNTGSLEAQLPGIEITPIEIGEPQSKFALTLYIYDKEEGLELEFIYQKDLYSGERMEEFARQYARLLDQIGINSSAAINSYSLLTTESQSLMPDPAAVLEEPLYPSVLEMFRAIVDRSPDAEAVVHRGDRRTYLELGSAVNAIAVRGLSAGLVPGEVVAVFGPRSYGLIAGMLGVLSAGGVLLTIDPSMLEDRIRLIVAASGAKRLLYAGSRRMEDEWLITDIDWADVLLVDEALASAPEVAASNGATDLARLPRLSPDDPAYVFFTSGTTGVPKGVLGRHKGLSHFLCWQREEFGIGPGDRGAQLTGLSFDVVLRDVLLPLTSGATVCLPNEESDLSAAQILPWMEGEKITYLHTVPALAQSWLGTGLKNVSLASLRYIFFAGEPLSGALITSWRSDFGHNAILVNLYGPTETTLAKCFYRVPDSERLPSVQPIGRPLPHAQVLLLNANGQQCGIGETGEIVIRTPFRTLGYIQPEEGSVRFAANPFTNNVQDVVYYTGDLGHYRPDGILNIAGRRDDQIKIRGMRVELGEIRSVLSGHPLIKDVIVIASSVVGGAKRLAAYFVSQNDTMDVAELRAYAKGKMPGFMVPGAFIRLEHIPLTPNGKIDRRRLPDPTAAFAETVAFAYAPPETALEKTIGKVWSKLLGISQVGIHDNFFDLGGHSLLLLQAKTMLTEVLGRDIPVVDLFQYPTVSSLAKYLNSGGEGSVLVTETHRERANMRQKALEMRRTQRMKTHNKISE